MEYLRGSVNLRAFGQRDPLTEYRKEGTRMFHDLEIMLSARVFEVIEGLTRQASEETAAAVIPSILPPEPTIVPEAGEIGRNDPCSCGSGKKWKNCGLKNTEEHQRLLKAK